jgi:ribose transport system permease protein
MSPSTARRWLSDYGIVGVLLLLGLLFSLLTLKPQHPTGAEAGEQTAERVLGDHGANVQALIVTRNTAEDRAFATSAAARLTAGGGTLLANVNGEPADARTAIAAALAKGGRIDAIIANDVTAKWAVYDRFPEVGASRCVTPQPYTWPDFLKLTNVLGVANQTAIYAIIAIGMTMVIIAGGIDLSVGSLVALSSVVSALIVRDLGGGTAASIVWVALASAGGIAAAAAVGIANGFLVTAFRMPAFIVTLGAMLMASGAAFRLAAGRSIPELPASFFWLGRGQLAGVPNPVVLMFALYAVAHVVMSRSIFGRHIYAIGGNERAAWLSGVPVRRTLLAVYTLCGALAGLGGILLSSQLSAGDPKFGLTYELEVISAVVVGGTSLQGGRGSMFGTLIGAFIIAVIKNGMNLINVDPFNQRIVLGAVLTAAVLLDTLKRRGERH